MTLLVLDIGSSSARALLFDEDARLIDGAEVKRAYQFETEPPGAAIFDVDALRWAVEACIDDILTHPAAVDIRAVAMDTFVGNIVGLDERGAPTTPVYLYADSRAADDAFTLRETCDERAAHARTGVRITSAYLPARFAWLRRTQPHVLSRAVSWVDFGTYLYRCWFGRALPCSYSVAGWTGLLHRADDAWDAVWLDALGVASAALPALAELDDAQCGLSPDYASRWRSLAEVPFFLPVGDGASANVGAGAVDGRSMALSVGTTAALRLVTPDAPLDLPFSLWEYRVTQTRRLIGGATSEGGGVFAWMREALHLPPEAEAALALRPRDGHGLTVLPLLAGERSPGYRSDATGTVHGLRLSTDALDLLQAGMEAVALRLALIARDLTALADPNAPIIASGGALASGALCQMIADALDRPIHLCAEREITARGTAVLVLAALDGAALDAFAPTLVRRIIPDLAGAAAMRTALERQTALYQLLYPG
jgi:gluconokinase